MDDIIVHFYVTNTPLTILPFVKAMVYIVDTLTTLLVVAQGPLMA